MPIVTEKVSCIRSNINLESVEEYSEGKIHKSEPELGNGNVNRPGEILESVTRSLLFPI